MTYEKDLILKVAWKYYNEGMTQNDIAEALNLSRMKVIKYLDLAKTNKIIQFKINLNQWANLELQNKLLKKYNLKDLYIVPEPTQNGLDSLTKAAAQFIEDRITSDTMLNIGYGESVSRTLAHLNISTKYNVTFVSLSGGVIFYMPSSFESSSYQSNSKYTHYVMPAPLIVSSPTLAEQLLNEKPIKRILEMIPYANITLIGIGALNERATIVKEGYLNKNDMEIMKSKGAVGDLLSQFYDINGNVIDSPLHKQLISTDISLLKSLTQVVAVAGGLEKKEAIKGALNGGYIDVLITDEQVAQSLV